MKETTRVRLETQFQEADRLMNGNAFEDAYNILIAIIDEEPAFGKAYNHLGWLFQWKMKDYSEAEIYYRKAIENSPEYFASYSNYAILLNQLQRWDDLLALTEKALLVTGALRGTLYHEVGIMYEKRGKLEEAIDMYKKSAMDAIKNDKFEAAKNALERCKEKMKLMR